jgi:ABC-2 type transport system ATP-binding protein
LQENAIIYDHVWKAFSNNQVLKDVSFAVENGEITGLLGPNGSGKTTLIRLTLGILRPDKGKILLMGKDPFREPSSRESVGYIPERPIFPSSVSIRELLILSAKLLRCTEPNDLIDEVLNWAGLSGHEYKRFNELSAGLKQRAAIAHALLSDPELIIADEPTSNLDPVERLRILDLLLELNRKKKITLVFTSHILAEVARIADKISVLMDGKLVFYGDPKTLVEQSNIISIRTNKPEHLSRMLEDRGYRVEMRAFSVIVHVEERRSISRLLRDLADLSKEIEIFAVDTVEAALERMLRAGGS